MGRLIVSLSGLSEEVTLACALVLRACSAQDIAFTHYGWFNPERQSHFPSYAFVGVMTQKTTAKAT
jgi:hypothetical protein